MKKLSDKRALSIAEAARYACVSRGTIEHWLMKKLLPCEELPSRGQGAYKFRRIRRDDLEQFLDSFYKENRKERALHGNADTGVFLIPRNT